jgi:hypothetical protein
MERAPISSGPARDDVGRLVLQNLILQGFKGSLPQHATRLVVVAVEPLVTEG